MRRSSLLLLDEPLVGLDPEARVTVIRAIRNIAQGRTTLVVHHGEIDEFRPDVHIDLDNQTPRPTADARPGDQPAGPSFGPPRIDSAVRSIPEEATV